MLPSDTLVISFLEGEAGVTLCWGYSYLVLGVKRQAGVCVGENGVAFVAAPSSWCVGGCTLLFGVSNVSNLAGIWGITC